MHWPPSIDLVGSSSMRPNKVERNQGNVIYLCQIYTKTMKKVLYPLTETDITFMGRDQEI